MPWAATTAQPRSSPARSITHAPIPRITSSWSAIPRESRAAAGGELPANVEIVPATQVIEMDEHPALALREKKDSSITVGCDLVKSGARTRS